MSAASLKRPDFAEIVDRPGGGAARGHSGRHGTCSSCRTSLKAITATSMSPPRAAWCGRSATCRYVSRFRHSGGKWRSDKFRGFGCRWCHFLVSGFNRVLPRGLTSGGGPP